MKTLKQLSGFILLILPLLTLTHCNDIENPAAPGNYTIDVGNRMTATVYGQIIDENGMAVENASVRLFNANTTTDEFGDFVFLDADVYANHAYVKVEKPGYFLGSRSIVPTSGSNKMLIQLLPKMKVGDVSATQGGSISFNNTTIDFEGGFVLDDGTEVKGDITVYSTYIDPTAANLEDIMPGSLRAAGEDGETLLETFGMIGVELEDQSGREVQLKDGKTAKITLDIPPAILADAPSSIPLWHFDEEKGYWVEEGSAFVNDGKYVGSVKHFSFWNCDIPIEYTTSFGRVIDQFGNPIPGQFISLTSDLNSSWNRRRGGSSDSKGVFGGIMPANQAMVLHAYSGTSYNSDVIHTETVGPFSNDEPIGDIVVQLPVPAVVNGRLVDCDGNGSEGTVFVRLQDSRKFIQTTEDGLFEFIVKEGTDFWLKGYSSDNIQIGPSTKISDVGQTVEVGDLSFCKTNQGGWLQGDEVNIYVTTSPGTGGQDSTGFYQYTLADVAIFEDLDNNILKFKSGALNGESVDEFVTVEMNGTYVGASSYFWKPSTGGVFDIYLGPNYEPGLVDFDLNLSILSIDLNSEGTSNIQISGTVTAKNKSTQQNEVLSVTAYLSWRIP